MADRGVPDDDPGVATKPRKAHAEATLASWNTPSAWRWLDGRWSLTAHVLGREVPVLGGVRFSVEPGGVIEVTSSSPIPGFSVALTFVAFGRDGCPTLRLSSVTPDQFLAVLRAVSATRNSVTFEGAVDPVASPLVLRATLRRSGASGFRIEADARLGAATMRVLTYEARKLDGA